MKRALIVAACALALMSQHSNAAPRAVPAPTPKAHPERAVTDYDLEVMCPKAAVLIRVFEREMKSKVAQYTSTDWTKLFDLKKAFADACPGVDL